MQIEITPSVYLALCALVKDALEVQSDAAPILRQAALQLAAIIGDIDDLPETLASNAKALAAINELREQVLSKKSAA